MTGSNLYKMLAKHFSGESSFEEEDNINRWLEECEKNKIIFEEIKSIWNSTNLPIKNFDKEKAWKNVISKSENSGGQSPFNNKFTFTSIVLSPNLLKIAASVVFFIILTIWGVTHFLNSNIIDFSKPQIISADKNEIRRVRLDDGSVVTLNSESSLKVPGDFNKINRSVGLSGEAFFEIASNKQKPFYINAHSAIVKVVGTKFNLTAWEEDSEITVAVTEGIVEFNSSFFENENAVFVSKGEVSSIIDNNSPLRPIKLEVEKYYLFWLNDELNFYNASFKSVIQRLEMKYNVDILVDDISILSKHLTANFNNDPLSEVLNTISIALNLGYSVNQNRVVFNYLKSNAKN